MTIGELAKACGVSADTVRFYERQKLLPRPRRSASGYRLFGADDAARVRFVRRAQATGLTLDDIGDFSGAAAALRFEPFRPYLLAVTYGLLAVGFYLTYRPAPECAAGAPCEIPGASRTAKALLWLSAVAVMVVTAFPWYSIYLF